MYRVGLSIPWALRRMPGRLRYPRVTHISALPVPGSSENHVGMPCQAAWWQRVVDATVHQVVTLRVRIVYHGLP